MKEIELKQFKEIEKKSILLGLSFLIMFFFLEKVVVTGLLLGNLLCILNLRLLANLIKKTVTEEKKTTVYKAYILKLASFFLFIFFLTINKKYFNLYSFAIGFSVPIIVLIIGYLHIYKR